MNLLYETYIDMLCVYMDSREEFKAIKKGCSNMTAISEAKTRMDFNRAQMQLALDKYLLSVIKGGAS